MKRIKIYQWLYEKGGLWYKFYMFLVGKRMQYYIATGNKLKAILIIHEHIHWTEKITEE